MDASGPESDGRETFGRRACDQCRLRKIRCDKRSPCSNCRNSNMACRSTGAGQKPREQRKRVLISSQYERKIDLIEQRLGSIEQVLRELKPTGTPTAKAEPCFHSTPVSGQLSPSASGFAPNPGATLDEHESSPTFEGNSSLAAHSAYASEFLESAVSRSALQMSTPKIGAALATLKQIVNMQDNQAPSSTREVHFPLQRIMPRSGLRELPMPPTQVVLPLLRKLKERPSSVMQALFPFISIDRFTEACRGVYFATEDYSHATFIVVNGGLYYMFEEYGYYMGDREMKDAYDKYSQLCRINLETALASLNLLMPAKVESIEALTIGAIYAIEMSKPSFALTLSSTASRLCQTLGYHRASSMEHDSRTVKQNKIFLFWAVYCIDKPLSLRLGRASTIQDYDISLPATLDTNNIPEPWSWVFPLWIKVARIQGKVYELLYSPAALCQAEDERASQARQLAAEMQWAAVEPFNQVMDNLKNPTEIEKIYIQSDEVIRLSTMTLIYRAIPAPPNSQSTFIRECIDTARTTLESHQRCMNMLKEGSENMKCSYLHWTILYAPFVPFIVLFCHTIEISSRSDLACLEDFVISLQPNCALSEAIDKLYRLCQVLCNVARLYIEAKAKAAQTQENQDLVSVGQEFDSYLTALGLAPAAHDESDAHARYAPAAPVAAAAGPMGAFRAGAGTGVDEGLPTAMPQTTLGNWFSGNQHMMGLLEEDLSLFDPSALS